MSDNSQTDINENESEEEEEKQLTKLEELQEEKNRIKGVINQLNKKSRKEQNDGKKSELELRLRIARLEQEINEYKIDLENAADPSDKRDFRSQINTKEKLLLGLNEELQQLQQASQPPPEEKHTITVRVYAGEKVQDLSITFTNMQAPALTVKTAVAGQEILNRRMSLNSFKLVTPKNAVVTDFDSIKNQTHLIYHIPERIIPLPGNEWTKTQLDQLKIEFEDVDLATFFNTTNNLTMSERGNQLVTQLNELDRYIEKMYVVDLESQFPATEKKIRENPMLQNPICKALFASKKYSTHESFVDDFVKHLLNVMGFNEGSLYAAPLMRMNLLFGDIKKEATADVTIIDLLSFARIGVIEDKNYNQQVLETDSTPQLIAEGIAITQLNEVDRGKKRSFDGEIRGESEVVYGIRVTGHYFHFYAITVTSAIRTALSNQTSAVEQSIMHRYKSDEGLNFLDKTEREEIILILSILQRIATATGINSPRRNSWSKK